jgi:hypothetical protein
VRIAGLFFCPDRKEAMSSGPLSGKIPVVADDWRLTRDPVTGSPWKLFSPLWRGDIELRTADLFSPKRIRIAAADQKAVLLPAAFEDLWLKPRITVDVATAQLAQEAALLERLMAGRKVAA